MGYRIVLIALALLLPLAATQAQEKYTVKIKEPAVGVPTQFDVKITDKLRQKTTSEKDKEPKSEESQGTVHLIFTETILEKPVGAALPTKAKRVYEKAIDEGTNLGGGKRPGELAFHGKTVQIEKKDAGYDFLIEGGKVLDVTETRNLVDDFREGNMRATFAKFIVPPAPIAVSESWKFDPKKFLDKKAEGDLGLVKSEGQGTLTRVYKKEGRLYGMIDVAVELQRKTTVPVGNPNDMTSMTMMIKLTFDGCIDGTFAEGQITTTITMQSQDTFAGGGTEVTSISSSGDARTRETWLELPKK